jgi:hypothetical protein
MPDPLRPPTGDLQAKLDARYGEFDESSGVRTADVLTQDEAQAVLDRAWQPMVETKTHLAVRRMQYDRADGNCDAIVIVARGEAAQMLSDFTPTIPSFKADP